MEYTDETKLNFGKYKGYKLSALPSNYLVNLYIQFVGTDLEDRALMKYIEDKKILNHLQYKRPFVSDTIGHKMINGFVHLICKYQDKIIFPSENDAKIELRRIWKLEQNNKKPKRIYECDKCGGWHLTSKQLIK